MTKCPSCGVEIDGEAVKCPLCGGSLIEGDASSRSTIDDPDPGGELDPDSRRRARFWLWEIFTIVIVATAIIVAATDFAYGFDMSWAAYPLVSLAFVWLFVTIIAALGRRLPVAYIADTVCTLVFLYVLDLLTPVEPWFVPFALPTTLLVAVVGGAAAGIVRGLKLSIFPTLAVGAVAVGVFLVGFEIILSFALGLESILSWSIVALGGCLSIALLLWIINRRLRERHADFKRLFHL